MTELALLVFFNWYALYIYVDYSLSAVIISVLPYPRHRVMGADLGEWVGTNIYPLLSCTKNAEA